MSKKQLKNLARDNLDAELSSEAGEEVKTDSTERVNKFALLDEAENNDSDEQDELVATTSNLSLSEQISTAKAAKNAKKRRQRQNAKMQKAEKLAAESEEKPAPEEEKKPAAEEEKPAPEKPKSGDDSKTAGEQVLKVVWPDLNPDNELRKVLGPLFVPPPPEFRSKGRGGNKARRPQYRLVQCADEWRAVDFGTSGLSLIVDDFPMQKRSPSESKYVYYRFAHSPSYQAMQELFLSVLSTKLDIVEITEATSFNMDANLVYINRVIQLDEPREARNVLEFSIYVLESTFPIGFDLLSPYTRFDYNALENRCFFLLLFHHMKFLISRRCFFTALQVAKLILLKDMTDPLAIMLIIDSLALKAKEYQFLIDFYEAFKTSHNVDKLPNMPYSVAFATHLLAIEKNDNDLDAVAATLLVEAVSKFPDLLGSVCRTMKVWPSKDVSSVLKISQTFPGYTPTTLAKLFEIYEHHQLEDVWERNELISWVEPVIENAVRISAETIRKEVKINRANNWKVFISEPKPIIRHGFFFEIVPITVGLPAFNPAPPPANLSRSQYPQSYDEVPKTPPPTRPVVNDSNRGSFIWDMVSSVGPDSGPGFNAETLEVIRDFFRTPLPTINNVRGSGADDHAENGQNDNNPGEPQ